MADGMERDTPGSGYTADRIHQMIVHLAISINSLEGALIALHGEVKLSQEAQEEYLRRMGESQSNMRILLELMNGKQSA